MGFDRDGDHIAIHLRGARVLFTTRLGGHSRGEYASLNLGRMTNDDRASVDANRDLLERRLGVRLVFVRQVHGARVVVADGERADGDALPEADGQVTDRHGIAALALVADCLPVAVAADDAVAMLHCGWRGLAGGVIEEGVRRLRELGARGTLAAAIGPGAGPCCYEVGDEVLAHFSALGDGVLRDRKLNLKAIARAQLQAAGVQEIHDVELCTIHDQERFFSHRRDQGVTGRQAGIAWLT